MAVQYTHGRDTVGSTGSLRFRKGEIRRAGGNRRYVYIVQGRLNNTRNSCLELHKFLGAPNKSVVAILEQQGECLTGIGRGFWKRSGRGP